jgi:hypothetical protein
VSRSLHYTRGGVVGPCSFSGHVMIYLKTVACVRWEFTLRIAWGLFVHETTFRQACRDEALRQITMFAFVAFRI